MWGSFVEYWLDLCEVHKDAESSKTQWSACSAKYVCFAHYTSSQSMYVLIFTDDSVADLQATWMKTNIYYCSYVVWISIMFFLWILCSTVDMQLSFESSLRLSILFGDLKKTNGNEMSFFDVRSIHSWLWTLRCLKLIQNFKISLT